MKYMLDTNIIIALAMGDNKSVVSRAAECDEGDIVTSAIALAEVVYGSIREKPPALEQLAIFLEEVPVLPFDYKAAVSYAEIPFKRGGYDRLIAAHALSHDLIVVTHNERHFADVPGLRVENWTA